MFLQDVEDTVHQKHQEVDLLSGSRNFNFKKVKEKRSMRYGCKVNSNS
jgi:hypothetical protein